MKELSKNYLALTILIIIFLGLAWINTGTLNLYGATLSKPLISYCGYLLNIDNSVFVATYHFVDGNLGEQSTLLLRRILYPVISYPFMKSLNFLGSNEWYLLGGFLTNLTIYLALIVLLWNKFKRQYGWIVAVFGILLFISYPGIYYWIGSPYAYNWIIPGSILAYLLLNYIYESNSACKQCLAAFTLGIIFLGYDLWVFFLPACIILLVIKRQYVYLVPFSIIMLLPVIFWNINLKQILGIEIANSNSLVYTEVLSSFFTAKYYFNYTDVIAKFPGIFLHNFFYSGFLILPIFFLLIWLGAKFCNFIIKQSGLSAPGQFSLNPTEIAILLAIFAVFCFNNLAPLSDHRWQMRGEWTARLYQPVFVVFFFYLVRTLAAANGKVLKTLFIIILPLNLTIVLGPILQLPFYDHIYYNFYQHSPQDAITKNIAYWKKRPLGYCWSSKKVRNKIKKINFGS